MPARHVPIHVPTPIDNFLLDEEFDIFDIAASFTQDHPELVKDGLSDEDEISWDEFDNDNIPPL